MTLEQRVTELEIKLGYAEDLLDEVNRVVFRQQEQIEALLQRLGALTHQVHELEPRERRDPREDIPPHY